MKYIDVDVQSMLLVILKQGKFKIRYLKLWTRNAFCNCKYAWLNFEQILTFVIEKHLICKSLHKTHSKILLNDFLKIIIKSLQLIIVFQVHFRLWNSHLKKVLKGRKRFQRISRTIVEKPKKRSPFWLETHAGIVKWNNSFCRKPKKVQVNGEVQLF